jgi:hypothetical protein
MQPLRVGYWFAAIGGNLIALRPFD